jgi:hypothetical protein
MYHYICQATADKRTMQHEGLQESAGKGLVLGTLRLTLLSRQSAAAAGIGSSSLSGFAQLM